MTARVWVRRWAVGVCAGLVAASVSVPSVQAQALAPVWSRRCRFRNQDSYERRIMLNNAATVA